MNPIRPHLPCWAVCPRCCRAHDGSSCPSCQEPGASSQPLPELSARRAEALGTPLQQRGRSANPELGGLTLGVLGIVPLLGLVFCLLGMILSLAGLRTARAQRRPTGLAYLALAVSLSTALPGILLWGWLRAASAAW